jgi:hypothetical protein
VSLPPALHNACDVLIAEGKWKRALSCGHVIAKVHGLSEVDPFVLGSVATFFAHHKLLDAGRSVIQSEDGLLSSRSSNLGAPIKAMIFAALQQQHAYREDDAPL